MTEPAFHQVTVVSRWNEAEGLHGLRLQVPESVRDAYQVPGQYVQLRIPAEPPNRAAFLAIASPPGQPDFEFLIKGGHAPADALIALPNHAVLEMSDVQGRGYPIRDHLGQDILLFAVGSGISPIRALIGYLAQHRDEFAGVTLFHGARTRAHLAYQEEVAQWQRAGVDVIRVVSQPGDEEDGYARGYVQHALQAHPLGAGPAVAFVCGMASMVEAVTSELGRRGVPAEWVFQNY